MLKIKHTAKKGYGLFATEPIGCCDFIMSFFGKEMPYDQAPPVALQVGLKTALLPDLQCQLRFLNHSCEPNCAVGVKEKEFYIYAIRSIEEGEELTINYNTSEFNLIDCDCNFECNCGSHSCIKYIKGYSHLNIDQQKAIIHICLPYLREK